MNELPQGQQIHGVLPVIAAILLLQARPEEHYGA
jgi:hypothetical protein